MEVGTAPGVGQDEASKGPTAVGTAWLVVLRATRADGVEEPKTRRSSSVGSVVVVMMVVVVVGAVVVAQLAAAQLDVSR